MLARNQPPASSVSAGDIPCRKGPHVRLRLYVIGFIVFVGVLYTETLLHVPQAWALVTALVLTGAGVMRAVSYT
jgi:hypothetical protein